MRTLIRIIKLCKHAEREEEEEKEEDEDWVVFNENANRRCAGGQMGQWRGGWLDGLGEGNMDKMNIVIIVTSLACEVNYYKIKIPPCWPQWVKVFSRVFLEQNYFSKNVFGYFKSHKLTPGDFVKI